MQTANLAYGTRAADFIGAALDRFGNISGPAPADEARAVVRGLAETGRRRATVIASLVRGGNWPEAAVLARTLTEIAITSSYIWFSATESDRLNRARRFLAFDAAEKVKLLDIVAKVVGKRSDDIFEDGPNDGELVTLRAKLSNASEEHDRLKEAAAVGWSGVGRLRMVESVTDGATRLALKMSYPISYQIFSSWVHPTLAGVRHIVTDQDHGDGGGAALVPLSVATALDALFRAVTDAAGMAPATLNDLIVAFVSDSRGASEEQSNIR